MRRERREYPSTKSADNCDCIHMIGLNERGSQICGNAYCPNGNICIYTSYGASLKDGCPEYVNSSEYGIKQWEKFYVDGLSKAMEYDLNFPLDEYIRNEVHSILVWAEEVRMPTISNVPQVLDKIMGLINAARCLYGKDILKEMEEIEEKL